MLDFVKVRDVEKRGVVCVYPSFMTYNNGKECSDIMIQGGDFYAIWDESAGRWSTKELDAFRLIDREIQLYLEEIQKKPEYYGKPFHPQFMWDADSGSVDKWRKFCKQQIRENFVLLDQKIIFSNDEVSKENYASKSLSYPLKKGSTKNWNTLMGVLYSKEELRKLEWSVGAIVTGASKTLQKFIVLYGSAGTGKSTFLNVVQMLFKDYWSSFDAKSLGSSNSQFSMEAFISHPLIAIQHDGDLSRIEDNTRLNSIVSHEPMIFNIKNKSQYTESVNAFLYMGTNTPVKITDSKSGILRRLIDVSPTGNKVTAKDYDALMNGIQYELGAIAYKCKMIFEEDPHYYDSYIPVSMMSTTNDFYDYILENTDLFEEQDYTTLKQAWKLYRDYCEEANVPYSYKRIKFKEELKNYFENFEERGYMGGAQVRNLYSRFNLDKFQTVNVNAKDIKNYVLMLDKTESILDDILKDCPAQYANEAGTPNSKWERVRRTLKDIDTKKIHYVKVPENHIVIDFDIKDETGEKSYEENLKAASKFPPTYAELSKSGAGLHLHYIYDGDVDALSTIYAKDIEIKVFKGNSSLRRKLSKCNDIPIATISSGLPLREKKGGKMDGALKNEKAIVTTIRRAMEYKYHANTKPSVDWIKEVLDRAYESGISYDVSNMRGLVFGFASNSSNNKSYCMDLVGKMKWMSKDREGGNEFMNPPERSEKKEPKIIFLDIEVGKNVLLICWKRPGKGKHITRMFNPTPAEVEALMNYDWIGHNLRKYDNHIIIARWKGFSNEGCYNLSHRIIVDKDPKAFFSSGYRSHYADTLDYPVKKQGLKKWEIDLHMPHKEMDIDWNEPIPEKLWDKLADYCENDVLATEAVWDATQADFEAREILAAISGGDIRDTTNQLSAKFIFGSNKNPQASFNYRNMGDESTIDEKTTERMIKEFPHKLYYPEYVKFTKDGKPVFPGYIFEKGKSRYRDEDPKEGGYAFSIPGFYGLLALLDIASMHPSSIEAENLFGDEYTPRFSAIKQIRIYIKHGEYDKARQMFNGKLAPYLENEEQAEALSTALKIVINSVYGLTKARHDNPFRDKRNKDNIVAKRGALFMINLKHEVQARGFIAAHIKTDSIKIPDATPEIIKFVNDYGKLYGYDFEHEATYDRMMIVDKSNYVCKYAANDICKKLYGYVPTKQKEFKWDVTGDKFCKPRYIFKTMFTKDKVIFDDVCEMKSVETTIYLDENEGLADVSEEEKEVKKLESKYRKGELSDTTFEKEMDRLIPIINNGHNYKFVGKVGNFVPVIDGCGGGYLRRKNNKTGKYDAVNGSKGTRWMEADDVLENNLEDHINYGYFDKRIDELRNEITISCTNGDLEWFVSDDPYVGCEYDKDGRPIYSDEIPF